jgi:hypothetical protein
MKKKFEKAEKCCMWDVIVWTTNAEKRCSRCDRNRVFEMDDQSRVISKQMADKIAS